LRALGDVSLSADPDERTTSGWRRSPEKKDTTITVSSFFLTFAYRYGFNFTRSFSLATLGFNNRLFTFSVYDIPRRSLFEQDAV
jgi:hypothetical protein